MDIMLIADIPNHSLLSTYKTDGTIDASVLKLSRCGCQPDQTCKVGRMEFVYNILKLWCRPNYLLLPVDLFIIVYYIK